MVGISSTFADYDGDGISDENDSDDDNDEIPDDFEVKYSGPYTGPWKPADDRRATLCPRIKVNLACCKYFNIIRDLWDSRTGGNIFMVKRNNSGLSFLFPYDLTCKKMEFEKNCSQRVSHIDFFSCFELLSAH